MFAPRIFNHSKFIVNTQLRYLTKSKLKIKNDGLKSMKPVKGTFKS